MTAKFVNMYDEAELRLKEEREKQEPNHDVIMIHRYYLEMTRYY